MLTIERSIGKDAHPLMRCKIAYLDLPFLAHLACEVDTGRFWYIPVTTFCPGPRMGLYQFKRMLFGLAGAPSSFQHLIHEILRELPLVTCCLDEELVHSADVKLHGEHLKEVFH